MGFKSKGEFWNIEIIYIYIYIYIKSNCMGSQPSKKWNYVFSDNDGQIL